MDKLKHLMYKETVEEFMYTILLSIKVWDSFFKGHTSQKPLKHLGHSLNSLAVK